MAIDVPHAAEVTQCLLDRDILVDFRPDAGIRIAPHFYTTDEEIDEAMGAIVEIIQRGQWRRHEGVARAIG